MNLIKALKPSVFQGSLKNKNYFEGWYFKQVSSDGSSIIAVIPGISLSTDPHSFIQFIDGKTGEASYISYPLNEFKAASDILEIRIGKNYFSENRMILDIDREDFSAKGSLSFTNTNPWKGSLLSPGVMGWYSWVPGMECYHGVVSMDHQVEGTLTVNSREHCFSSGRGYIEKDWGSSFPECWVWTQGNNFGVPGVSFMFSAAKIPWMKKYFPGYLCFFLHEGTVYKFMTWNGAELVSLKGGHDKVSISLSGKKFSITAEIKGSISGTLKAPVSGSMDRYIKEGVDAELYVRLSDNSGNIIFQGTTVHAGLEVVGDIFQYIH